MAERKSVSILTAEEVEKFDSIENGLAKWKKLAKRIVTLLTNPEGGELEGEYPTVVGYYTGLTNPNRESLNDTLCQKSALTKQVKKQLKKLKKPDRLYSGVRIAGEGEKPGYHILFSFDPIPKPRREQTEREFFLARREGK